MAYIDIGGGPGGGGTGGGLIPFAPSLLVATTPITPSGVRSIDGHDTATFERVLLTAQADPIQNGIWLTDGLGAWQRPSDLPVGANAAFAFTFIQEGDTYANTGWANGTVPESIVGTDPQQWVQVIAPGQLQANNGLTLTGVVLDVVPDPDGSLVATPGNLKVGVLATDAQHGDRGGGTLHAQATPLTDGFLSAADKTKLDALPTTGVPETRIIAAGGGLTGGGNLTIDRTLSVGPAPDGSILVENDYIIVGILAADVQHGARGGGTLHTTATTGSPGFMSDTDKVKLDTVETGATNTPLSSSLPSTIVPGAAGSGGLAGSASRADHIHGVPSGPPVDVTKAPNAEGTSSALARADHKHDVATANVVTIGGTGNFEGTSTALARADHVHFHGALTNPLGHALVTPSAHGFMSSDDKIKLDTVSPGAATGLVVWGANAVSGTTTTRYLYPFYGAQLAPTSAVSYRMARAGTFLNMRVRHNVASGNAELIKYTLRVNGVATLATVSLAANATDAAAPSVFVPVVAGDLVDLEVTKALSVGTSPTDILVSMELAG